MRNDFLFYINRYINVILDYSSTKA